ncbi:Protein ASPARTIC PROTEASE IN GUARD CELL 1 [Bienertia sinuspersici]
MSQIENNMSISSKATKFLQIFILSLILCTHPITSTTYTFTSLDVSSSLSSALSLFSTQQTTDTNNLYKHDSGTTTTTTTSNLSSSGTLSLEIHPRVSLHAPHRAYTDYRALTMSRLARDTARVNSIIAKTNLRVMGIRHMDLNPLEDQQLMPNDLEAPVSSGTSMGSGEYFSRLGVGSPSKEFFMVIDTGSDISWLQCQPCSDCYQQTDPIFSPSSSSSYSPLTCNTRECTTLEVSACRNSACLYQVSYGDGSYTVGDFVTETVSFGSSGRVPKVAIGCGHENEGLFVGAAGLLGLGGGPLSLTSQIKATSFSYCLVDRDSPKSSALEFNAVKPADSVTAPLLKSNKVNTFYYVGLTGFSVGGQQISIPPSLFGMDDSGSGGVIVDSGTAVTRLPSQAYSSLRDSFTRLTQHLKPTGNVALFDTCYDFSSLSSVKVPTVALHFAGGQTLDLPAKNYLIPVDSSGTYCFAFAETASSMSIIGNVQQQGIRVHYDLAKSQVAFSPNNC